MQKRIKYSQEMASFFVIIKREKKILFLNERKEYFFAFIINFLIK